MSKLPSVNRLVQPLVRNLVENGDVFGVAAYRSQCGAQLLDAGISARGGIEAGRRIAEICLGGLGTVTISNIQAPRWQTILNVHTTHPVIACLASQYAGWDLAHGGGEGKFRALASGPGRSLACKEPLFHELAYRDVADTCTLVLETDQEPPDEVIAYVAAACKVAPAQLNFIMTPTNSLAGSFQVVSRVLEVALHKAHTLGFAMDAIVDGVGSAPLTPPSADFITAMGRTNDAIMFAGRVHLFVGGDVKSAENLAMQLPSSTSKDYGKPFAQVFKDCGCDFFRIDPMLFSPAQVTVSHLPSGRTFHAGEIDAHALDLSFTG